MCKMIGKNTQPQRFIPPSRYKQANNCNLELKNKQLNLNYEKTSTIKLIYHFDN